MKQEFKIAHNKLDTVIKAMESAKRNSKNIMLSGPVGSSKTTLCQQIADKLSLDFYPFSLCQQTTKSDLLGFLDAGGNYRTSALRQAYENGGLVLLDEMDTSNPNVLIIINNLLSNNQYYFPDGIVKKHDDFRCICVMNSNGLGGEVIYTKSQRLDASTLDRFVFIKIDIDDKLEKTLTDNKEWYERVLKFREVISTICKDDIAIGMRAMLDGADLLDSGFSLSEVEDMVIYKGIDEDIVESIKAKMDIKPEINVDRKRKGNSNNSGGYTEEDGLLVLENQSKDTKIWLDKDFCIENDFELLNSIKETLGL